MSNHTQPSRKLRVLEYQNLYNHLLTHYPEYKNMHMREARIRGGKRQLRYLHIMRINPEGLIEGAVNGPEIKAEYKLMPLILLKKRKARSAY